MSAACRDVRKEHGLSSEAEDWARYRQGRRGRGRHGGVGPLDRV